MLENIGYCCINMELSEKGISTNRGMIKRTFEARGLKYASELFLKNSQDLFEVIKWNHENGFKVYRMSSCLCPWMSEFEFTDLPDYEKIKEVLYEAGQYAIRNGQRLSFHPGQFTILASPNPDVVRRAIKDLNQHSEIMDMMGLPVSPWAAINIHVGGTYGNKEESMERFCESYQRLDENTKKRLVVENDDKGSMYSVKDLYSGIFSKVGVPITFDFHHHRFCTGDLSEEEALKLASTTWPTGVKPLTHYSSCRRTHEDSTNSTKVQAHADFIYEKINTYGLDIDIEAETKAKEKAVLKYRKDVSSQFLLNEYLPFDYAY